MKLTRKALRRVGTYHVDRFRRSDHFVEVWRNGRGLEYYEVLWSSGYRERVPRRRVLELLT